MNKQEIIRQVKKRMEQKFRSDTSGHDWWHIERVRRTAVAIAKKEDADIFIVELAALLHDIADWKFHDGNDKAGGVEAKKLLDSLGVDAEITARICFIVDNISFKGSTKSAMTTIEGKVVQDADRLDALGAIGIARAFAYGGWKGRPLYDPAAKPKKITSFAQYRNGSSSTIHHFYEKLLLLKDHMNTKTGEKMAARRHRVMKQFLNEFYREWNT